MRDFGICRQRTIQASNVGDLILGTLEHLVGSRHPLANLSHPAAVCAVYQNEYAPIRWHQRPKHCFDGKGPAALDRHRCQAVTAGQLRKPCADSRR